MLPVYLLVETSSAMRGEPFVATQTALKNIASALDRSPHSDDISLCMIAFNSTATVQRPLSQWNKGDLMPKIVQSEENVNADCGWKTLCTLYNQHKTKDADAPILIFITSGSPPGIAQQNKLKRLKNCGFGKIQILHDGSRPIDDFYRSITFDIESFGQTDIAFFDNLLQVWSSPNIYDVYRIGWQKIEDKQRELDEVRKKTAAANSKPVIVMTAPPQVQLSPSGQKAGERLVIPMKDLQVPFRWCPAGTFTMGEGSESHKVTLTKGFWMGETQVTREQWQAITGSKPPESPFAGANLPVEGVSWDDCQDFVERLNAQNAAPAGFKFALPTEAQWEYACRAGTTTAFNFGSALNGDKANCDGNYPYGTSTKGKYLGKTTPVGSYPANAWGLRDMHGNVWEWCQDRYGSYNGDEVDPVGASSGSFRVARGGSWRHNAEYCRSAYRRNDFAPGSRYSDLGLRVALVSI